MRPFLLLVFRGLQAGGQAHAQMLAVGGLFLVTPHLLARIIQLLTSQGIGLLTPAGGLCFMLGWATLIRVGCRLGGKNE